MLPVDQTPIPVELYGFSRIYPSAGAHLASDGMYVDLRYVPVGLHRLQPFRDHIRIDFDAVQGNLVWHWAKLILCGTHYLFLFLLFVLMVCF